MTALRLLRIAGIAAGFWVVFNLSQQATLARQGAAVPGISWAIGVLSLFFLIGAIVTERSQGPEANGRKDLLWGLAAGGIAIVVSRF
jgi:peptidoglycan/LPS O-acetylase OafA/YrhL